MLLVCIEVHARENTSVAGGRWPVHVRAVLHDTGGKHNTMRSIHMWHLPRQFGRGIQHGTFRFANAAFPLRAGVCRGVAPKHIQQRTRVKAGGCRSDVCLSLLVRQRLNSTCIAEGARCDGRRRRVRTWNSGHHGNSRRDRGACTLPTILWVAFTCHQTCHVRHVCDCGVKQHVARAPSLRCVMMCKEAARGACRCCMHGTHLVGHDASEDAHKVVLFFYGVVGLEVEPSTHVRRWHAGAQAIHTM